MAKLRKRYDSIPKTWAVRDTESSLDGPGLGPNRGKAIEGRGTLAAVGWLVCWLAERECFLPRDGEIKTDVQTLGMGPWL